MIRTVSRWYPVLLLRDALGRFVSLRTTPLLRARRRTPRIKVTAAVQLALF